MVGKGEISRGYSRGCATPVISDHNQQTPRDSDVTSNNRAIVAHRPLSAAINRAEIPARSAPVISFQRKRLPCSVHSINQSINSLLNK